MAGRRDDRQVAVVEQQGQQCDVDLFHRAGIVVAQHAAAAVLDDLDGILALAFQQAAVEARETDGIGPRGLQHLDDALVDFAAIDHLEYPERLAVGAPAGVAGERGDELGRVAQLLGDHVGAVRAAVHEHERLPLSVQGGDIACTRRPGRSPRCRPL